MNAENKTSPQSEMGEYKENPSKETGKSQEIPPAIQVMDISKIYKLYNKPSDRLKESLGLT